MIDIPAKLQECAKDCPWDEQDQREEFEHNIEQGRLEEAWENLVYYWHSDERDVIWWAAIISIANALGNEEKVSYAQMRQRLMIEKDQCVWTLRLGPDIRPYWSQPSESGTYLVWIENEKTAYWTIKTFIHDNYRERDASSQYNGMWMTDSWRHPIIYWRDFPDAPRGHKKWQSETIYD